jgi:hypothetical protein
MKSFLNQKQLPRGIRNNNPGNLVKTAIPWKGKIPHAQNTDSRFEQFENIGWGVRAMAMDILSDIKKGKNTLRTLITEYAPPSENDTAAYINSVSKQTGLQPDEKIKTTPDILAAIINAKIRVENGSKAKDLIFIDDVKKSLELLPGKMATAVKAGSAILPVLLLAIYLIFKK